ncbi:unnamed protein product [Prunus brigantina]
MMAQPIHLMLYWKGKYFLQENAFFPLTGKDTEEDINMSSSSSAAARRGWVVAASVGVVEALKDQGICRWNYTMRLMQQHTKSQLGSFSQANKLSSSSSALVSSKLRDEKVKQSEESLRKVMYLSCWGPN